MDGNDVIQLSDHPGLAFVNSHSRPNRKLIEQLGSGIDYLRWLTDTGLLDDADAATATAAFDTAELDAVAAEARQLRESLRPALFEWSAGVDLAQRPQVRDDLNAVLALDARHDHITDDGRLVRGRRRWDQPRQLLVPPIAALADVLADGDRELIRNCEDPVCTLWFYDRTKAHRRRWCAMSLCGNRAKVRAHRDRVAAVPYRGGSADA